MTVDVAGFEQLMEQQRSRARAAQKKETITLSDADALGGTTFVGYDAARTRAVYRSALERVRALGHRADEEKQLL